MITINERVLIPYPPEVVWDVISDPARVVRCIEGSQLREFHDDGSFDARLAVKFAAIRVGFGARATLDLDEDQRIGRLRAQGSDTRGSTRVSGHADFAVRPETAGSTVDIDGTIELNGQLASLVTTGAAVVVARMTRNFAAQLTSVCAESTSAPAPAAGIQPAPSPTSVPERAIPAAVGTTLVAPARPAAPESSWRRTLSAVSAGLRRGLRAVRDRWHGLTGRRPINERV